MKTIRITNYINGLASFLDDKGIRWFNPEKDTIEFQYEDENQLFMIAFEFGKFYKES